MVITQNLSNEGISRLSLSLLLYYSSIQNYSMSLKVHRESQYIKALDRREDRQSLLSWTVSIDFTTMIYRSLHIYLLICDFRLKQAISILRT